MISGSAVVFSIPIARSTSSQPWPMPANGTTLASACNSWPALADVGRGFTRSLFCMTGSDPLLPVVSGSFRASWQSTVCRPNPAENLERLRKTVELAFGRFDFVQVPFATNHYTRSSPGLARPIAKLLRADFEFYGVSLHLL